MDHKDQDQGRVDTDGQRRDPEGRLQGGASREIGHEGAGGGSYGQGDFDPSARRSQFRDDQRSPAAVHQAQGAPAGFGGYGGPDDRNHESSKSGPEFEDFRSQQQEERDMSQGSSGGSTGGNIGGSSKSDQDDDRTKSMSSPGSSAPTDMSGVGAVEGGGAGMKGAGAVGGSSATMAVKTAGPGAPNPSGGATDAGVTTGSENKPG